MKDLLSKVNALVDPVTRLLWTMQALLERACDLCMMVDDETVMSRFLTQKWSQIQLVYYQEEENMLQNKRVITV